MVLCGISLKTIPAVKPSYTFTNQHLKEGHHSLLADRLEEHICKNKEEWREDAPLMRQRYQAVLKYLP